MIAIGTPIPDFELNDQHGTPISSSTLRGKHFLLSFHPLAWTGVCQRQMEALEMNASVFADLDTQAFGVSVDATPCKKAWAESINITITPLLADGHTEGSHNPWASFAMQTESPNAPTSLSTNTVLFSGSRSIPSGTCPI
jgi:peroxiredoxin